MLIQTWPVTRPLPYARNARKIPPAAVDKVASSLKEYGFRQPIVVDAEGVVIVGHTRLLAAKKLELTEVPVHVAEGLTPAQVKAYRLMDNRSHDESKWDLDLVGTELFELKALDFNIDLTGFRLSEVNPASLKVVEGASGEASESGRRVTRIELTEPQVFCLTKLLEATLASETPSRASVSYQAALRKLQQSRLNEPAEVEGERKS